MSVYSSGVTAYRDTTKWLVAFVPLSSLVAAGAVVGPDLLSLSTNLEFSEFVIEAWPGLVGIAAMIGGIWCVVSSGAAVLAAQPQDLAQALGAPTSDGKPGDDSLLTAAFNEGLAMPYYLDIEAFRQDLRAIAAPTFDPDSQEVKRAVATVGLVREWALHRDLTKAFEKFKTKFVVGLLVVVAGFLLAAVALREPSEFVPIPVVVADATSASAFEEEFGCTADKAKVWMVGGTWEEPELEADGANCSSELWEAADGDVRVRPAP